MGLTEQEKQELKQDILSQIKSESQGVNELQEVQSLDGVKTLPAMRGEELVTAPVSLLAKPATDAAAQALAAKNAAEMAAANAEAAGSNAGKKAQEAQTAAQAAGKAVEELTEVKDSAQRVIDQYESVAVKARDGATARFDGILEDASVDQVSVSEVSGVYYISAKKIFAGKRAGKYVSNWSGADLYLNENRTEIRKDKLYLLGSVLYAWNEADGTLAEASGTGGGNTINVSEKYPLAEGYYTLATAIKTVEDKLRAKGRCVTFEVSQGKYQTKQFAGTNLATWESESSWDDFGGGGTVKSVTLNGQKATPDSQGNISLTINETEVDETLDAGSTNPVQNRAITGKIGEIEAGTLFDSDVTEEDGKQTVTLKNKSGVAITQFTLAAGGGGGGETSSAKIVLGAGVDHNVIKEGGDCVLTYSYDHQYVGGEDAGQTTGQKATIEIRVLRGSILVYGQTIENVSRGTYTLNVSKYLQVGTTDIYVKATATDPDTGKPQAKQAYVNVKAVSLTLGSDYALSDGTAGGGYDTGDSAVIPYTVQGTGTKTVFLYVDGKQHENRAVTRSGTTNGSFSIPMRPLAVGRHTVQLVAEMEAGGGLTLRSESIYMDIFKAGSSRSLIGTKHVFRDGRILTDNHLTPLLKTGQYEQLSFEYAVYDAGGTPAGMTVFMNGTPTQNVSVPRTVQTYTNRFTAQGTQKMRLVCGATEYPLDIEVEKSGIDIGEATLGLKLKLSAAGRSNGEADPAHWEYGSVKTAFNGVDWNTSGWTGDALKLLNGAKAEIAFMPFTSDAATAGCTVEVEMKVSNITDKDAGVVSCMSGTKGFRITADKAMMYTGSTKEVADEDGGKTTQQVGVGRQYGSDMWVKIAFVIGKRSEGRLMELYVNGTRSAADIYGESDNFMQDSPEGITIDSSGADVEVRTVRVYDRALTDDEEMDNHIIDRRTLDEMAALFEENDVLGDDGRSIEFEKLRKKGKGIMLVVRKGGLDPVNAENNKKADFLSDVHLWLPDGRYVYLKNVYVRIQGTSSTKYPTKNYRIYCAKGETPEMYVDGVKQEELKVALRPGQKKVKVLCAKADYSDSSMVQNTGGAKLWNDMMKALGFLTPAQQTDSSVRTAIDGFPIDVFSAESMEDTPAYYGQYNLNHDKSDWQEIIGMKGVEGLDPNKAVAFEFLNNTQPLCLFQGKADLDAQAVAEFDNALEFNYPKDITWATATEAQKGAFKRLWGWIRDCVPSGATPDDISTFVSQKFKSELGQYINKDFLLCWWLFTDFFANVDQRAKNMIWATWNLLVWYILYYDGDTQQGDRNDSMLAYLYDVMRETWDAEKSKYAFEGHDSWLWCLVLANLKDDIVRMAGKIRAYLTEERASEVFDKEQQGNWCGRVYNKSGALKYIKPQTEGVIVKGQLVKYPYIYALKGDKQAFRHWFIKNRFSLLDAKYETGNFLSDNIDMYMSRKADAPTNTITVTASDLYYFGYGTNNAPHLQASRRAEKGGKVTLTFANAFTVNDPIRIYGASRIAELDMRGAADNLTGDVNLNKCKALRKLNMQTAGSGSTGWCMVIDQCRQLTDINLYGQTNARTGTLSSQELDFTPQTRLKTLDARGVDVQAVLIAPGAPAKTLKLGGNIQTLRLEYLPELKDSGLTLQNWRTVKTLRFAGCPNLDWQTIIGRCMNVERVRIEGIDMEDDGTLLAKYKALKGVDAEGNAVDYCALVGTVHLTAYMEDGEYAAMHEKFPELNIRQPDYTVIEFDDAVADDANVTNLDNGTGYRNGTAYIPSGHVTAILKQRHRVLAKVTKKATTRNVNMAGQDTTVNNLDGEMTYYPLDDANSNKYADGTEAKLDGTEGDWMMYEPFFWSKGINDYLKGKHYSCYSSNDAAHKPDSPKATVLTLEDIRRTQGGVLPGKKIMSGKETLQNSYTNDTTYSVCKVGVEGFKRVRFPSVPGTNLIGSVFVDGAGKVISSVVVPTIGNKFEAGMYLIADIPEKAVNLHFTILNTAEFDCVVLSVSPRIEDMEPEWVANDEHLCAVVGSTVIGSKLRAAITGGSTTGGMTWTDFHYYSAQRGMQQIDALMHSRIANLFYARYGRRDAQEQCGAGQHTYTRTTGITASYGMRDTIGYTEASSVNNGVTNSLIDNRIHQFAWYRSLDEYGGAAVMQVNSICCMGYEDIYGHKWDMMDGVDLPNDSSNYCKWRIWMPDGTVRMVKSSTNNDWWTTAVAHGRYMDVIPVGNVNGSSSTYYTDEYYISGAQFRVVFRGGYYAIPRFGISCSYASNDASNSYADVGSRLAFRGRIVRAQSVAAYKAASEVA